MPLVSNRFASALKTWLEAGLAFFYPDNCQLCGRERATASEGYVGPRCRQTARRIRRPFCERCGLPFAGEITTAFECSNCRGLDLHFVSARAAVVATGVVLDVIHRYKYKRALWFEPFLVDLLVREAGPQLRREEWDLIVPIPLHSLKEREREFNQADRLATRLSQTTGIPVDRHLVRRTTPTRTQTQLSREARAANVRHAFTPLPHTRLRNQRVVLVDDVLTTGATTSACARTLKQIGAGEVCVWTVARGL